MIPCGSIFSENSTQMNKPTGTSDAVWLAQLWEKLNEAYQFVADSFPWQTLKGVTTLDDDTYIVPADSRLITKVIDGNKQQYNFVAGANRPSPFNYNFYFDNPVSTPLAEGTTAVVSEYATTLTSTAEFPATTAADEYIRIADNVGIYKISTWTSTSLMTLADHFRGSAQSAAIFQIRPRGTQVLAFSDAAGDDITPSDVELTYVRTPLPLYKKSDLIELPGSCPAVSVKMLQTILALSGFNQAADRKQAEFLSAMSVMKANEPATESHQPTTLFQYRKRDAHGRGYVRNLSEANW